MTKRKIRPNEEGKLETNPQGHYKISPAMKAVLRSAETDEEVTEYFENVKYCIELNLCVDCGQDVSFTGACRDEHVKEYSISGLCKACQIKAFGE